MNNTLKWGVISLAAAQAAQKNVSLGDQVLAILAAAQAAQKAVVIAELYDVALAAAQAAQKWINHAMVWSFTLAAAQAHQLLVAAKPEGPLTAGSFHSKISAMLVIELLGQQLLENRPELAGAISDSAKATLPWLIQSLARGASSILGHQTGSMSNVIHPGSMSANIKWHTEWHTTKI